LGNACYNSVHNHVNYNSPHLLHEWDETFPLSLTDLKAVWQNNDKCNYRLQHTHDERKWICTLQKSDQYIIAVENTVPLPHPHAAIMHSTLIMFSTNIMRTVIFTTIQQSLEW